MPKISRTAQLIKNLKQFEKDVQDEYEKSLLIEGYSMNLTEEEFRDKECKWITSSKEKQVPIDNRDFAERNRRKAFLFCQSPKDRPKLMNEEMGEQELDRGGWHKYHQSVITPDSQIWKNFDQKAYPLVQQFLKSERAPQYRELPNSPEKYSFSPGETASLGLYMKGLSKKIKEKGYNSFENRYVRSLLKWLQKEALFKNTEFTAQHERHFLLSNGLSTERVPEWKNQKFRMNLRNSYYPIDEDRAAKSVQLLIRDVFKSRTEKESKVAIQVLLFVLVALAIAAARKKIPVERILEMKRDNIQIVAYSNKSPKLKRIIALQKESIPLTPLLADLLELGAPRKFRMPYFTIHRSTIEIHLDRVNQELGYDSLRDPLTPETFLMQPHLWAGVRGSSQK